MFTCSMLAKHLLYCLLPIAFSISIDFIITNPFLVFSNKVSIKENQFILWEKNVKYNEIASSVKLLGKHQRNVDIVSNAIFVKFH